MAGFNTSEIDKVPYCSSACSKPATVPGTPDDCALKRALPLSTLPSGSKNISLSADRGAVSR